MSVSFRGAAGDPPANPPSKPGGSGGGPDFVQSLVRGLEVIRAFGKEAPRLTLSEVAKATGLTRATARRFLLTLVEIGYVSWDGKHFTLTPKVLGLGYAYLSSMPFWDIAQAYMEEVVEAVRESCSISVLDGTEIVYVARVPTKRIMAVGLSIGTRLPAYCTSMGRVLLADLPPDELDRYFAAARLEKLTERTVAVEAELRRLLADIRRQGHAVVDQELEHGLLSVAVPIRDPRGRVLAALNVGSHAARWSRASVEREILPRLTRAAEEIGRLLPR